MGIPERLQTHAYNVFGKKGSAWIKRLPSLIEQLALQWKREAVRPVTNLSYNFVAHAYSTEYQTAVMLKICLPGESFAHEKHALYL